ncbi:Hypothetical predicted protein [Marmota monax]|uniref:Uncharacterized protein n=1 Tax=Marmota monax TaxID=9995 RepID=A0A5E4CLB9_MARMO|nr:hypothetical protein GHT09_012499 [Marmota monax]VTJ81869.1 Hypothetical predicted protein [Marmota monax]
MARHQRERAIQDQVHQNQFLREQYLQELHMQKLYTEYHVNPRHKVHTITKKPMSWHDNLEEPEDGPGPVQSTPTSAQGPLVSPELQDHRLNHFRVYKDITLYKAKLWLLGEKDHRK